MTRPARKFLFMIAGVAGLLFAGVIWFTVADQPSRKATSLRTARPPTRATPHRAERRLPPMSPTAAADPDEAAKAALEIKQLKAEARLPASTLLPEAATSKRDPRREVVEEPVREPDPREIALRKKLQGVATQFPDVTLRFVTCQAEGGDCRARAESTKAEDAEKFAAAVRHDQGALRPEIRVRERTTAFNGRVFQADVMIRREQAPSM